ncbi:MAG: hypothetical protein LBC74_14185 [Planctomycetaceae bacterium]|jgi:hypothetical protein|nr:hypothetical protein [Planctomycetaceae bacterium]
MRKSKILIIGVMVPFVIIEMMASEKKITRRKKEDVEIAKELLLNSIANFDRVCFLLGTIDDNNGHYQTFTSNKTLEEVVDEVKWMFNNDIFISDTMSYQRVTNFDNQRDIALLVKELFKSDYQDMSLRWTNCDNGIRYHSYGSEIFDINDVPDSTICKKDKTCCITLFSASLAKLTANYYAFDYEKNQSIIISTGGDIGYKGFLKKEKIETTAQKASFLTGVFLRYGCIQTDDYGEDTFVILFRKKPLSTAQVCTALLQELGCEDIVFFESPPLTQSIVFKPSADVMRLIYLIPKLRETALWNLIAY